MTAEEIQNIISAVLSSLKTNARSIRQLTPVQTLTDSDLIEIEGGKCVSYGVLKGLLLALASAEHDKLLTNAAKLVIRSAEIVTSADGATLKITTADKTISTTIPLVSSRKAGLIPPSYGLLLSRAGTRDGVAVLDGNGKLPYSALPAPIIEFQMTVHGVDAEMSSSGEASTSAGCSVVYDDECKRFLFHDAIGYFYTSWRDASSFGILDGHGVIPRAGRIYINRLENELSWWNGDKLVAIQSSGIGNPSERPPSEDYELITDDQVAEAAKSIFD